MSAREIVEQLTGRGVKLTLRNGEIGYDAPRGAVTPEVLAELRKHKAALIALLSPSADRAAAGKPATSKRFSIADDRPVHTPLFDPAWVSDRPFHRYVEPYKGYLLHRLKLDKRFVRARDVWMYEEDGTAVLDCLSQYGALPFGHNPPDIWAAITGARDSEVPAFAAHSDLAAAGELAEVLIGLWPEAGFENVVFANSGAEAVEAAIKLCRAATGRHAMLSVSGAFHGLTLGALTLGGNATYRDGFASTDGAVQLPYGDIAALQRTLKERPAHFAGFIVEPIQGEAGIIDPPGEYLKAARRLCDETGTLLVVDEVQTGLGRTGDLFASQYLGIIPDIMTLAKALGGGLMPIGACVYRRTARSERFGLRHSSTFAGGTLACRAGLAAIGRLAASDMLLVREVRENGAFLRAGLLAFKKRYPKIVSDVTGRGYMQGLRLNFENYWDTPGLLGLLHDQNILIHLIVSHLLNVGKVRLAPSFSAGNVLRIQPPLTAQRDHLERLLAALDNTLSVLASGDTAGLIGHLLSELGPIESAASQGGFAEARRPEPTPRLTAPHVGRFAFVVHPLSDSDFAQFDPVMKKLSSQDMRRLVSQFADFIDPRPIEAIEVTGAAGARAYGELMLIPYTPADMMRMPAAKALEEVELAVRTAQARGAKVVGLGGFTSIVTQGGLALDGRGLPALTSGNSFTATAAKQALLAACAKRGVSPGEAKIANIGAGGMIGRALSVLLAQHFARLVLVGNTTRHAGYRARSEAVALDFLRQLRSLRGLFAPALGSLAAHVASADRAGDDERALLAGLEQEGRLVIGQTLEACLPDADVIVLATSSLDTFLRVEHLKTNAIVCDVSRPFNVDPMVPERRPDVTLLDGGLVRLPPGSPPSIHAGPTPGIVYACAAETMLWALERAYDRVSPDGCMDISSIVDLEQIASKHGFVAEHLQ
jgi:acetylornithine/succinyldiaminopimelate/putrescine aminotransferase/predicted amino acid dehydrogenase